MQVTTELSKREFPLQMLRTWGGPSAMDPWIPKVTRSSPSFSWHLHVGSVHPSHEEQEKGLTTIAKQARPTPLRLKFRCTSAAHQGGGRRTRRRAEELPHLFHPSDVFLSDVFLPGPSKRCFLVTTNAQQPPVRVFRQPVLSNVPAGGFSRFSRRRNMPTIKWLINDTTAAYGRFSHQAQAATVFSSRLKTPRHRFLGSSRAAQLSQPLSGCGVSLDHRPLR